jgi:hypothetical protein
MSFGATVLTLLGITFQITGMGFAAVGYIETWRAFGPPGVPITDHWLERPRRAWRRVKGVIYRVLGRHENAVASAERAEGAFAAIDAHGRGRRGFPQLRKRMPAREAIPQLDERTRELVTMLNQAETQLYDRLDEVTRKINALETRVGTEVERLAGRDEQVATGGLYRQMDGLMLIGIGLVFQTLALLLDLGMPPT